MLAPFLLRSPWHSRSKYFTHDQLIIHRYVKDALWHVRNFPSTLGDAGIGELDAIAHAHSLSLDIDDHDPARFDSCGAEIRDGKLLIIVAPGRLGANSEESLKRAHLEKAMNEAPLPAGASMSYAVRKGIREDYDSEVEAIKTAIEEIVQRKDISFEPNFEATIERLKTENSKPSPKMNHAGKWEEYVGSFTQLYFKGVEDGLRRQGFHKDEMLREGFNEAVETGKIAFRIVDKLSYNTDCEVVVEKGILYAQVSVLLCQTSLERVLIRSLLDHGRNLGIEHYRLCEEIGRSALNGLGSGDLRVAPELPITWIVD